LKCVIFYVPYFFRRTLWPRGLRRGSVPARIAGIVCSNDTLWERVWTNLHAVEAPDCVKSTWYQAIHGILPTNEHFGYHWTHRHKLMCTLWTPRFAATSNRGLWGKPGDMDLDQGTNRCHLQNGPPMGTHGMDSASGFPTMASSKTGGNPLDSGSLDNLHPAVLETPFAA
jgi:hypothetical protein